MITHNREKYNFTATFTESDLPKYEDLRVCECDCANSENIDEINRMLEQFKLPVSDSSIVVKQPTDTQECSDVKYPRKSNINFSEWQPFRYPVLDFGSTSAEVYRKILASRNIGNMCRFMTTLRVNPSEYESFVNNCDFIEAIITTAPFTLTTNGSSVKFTPTNKYNFVGLYPISNSRYSDCGIIVDCETPMDIHVIKHSSKYSPGDFNGKISAPNLNVVFSDGISTLEMPKTQ